jgi:putative ABC transport system permease protein
MTRPPQIAERLLALSLDTEHREAVLGDLEEEYARFVLPALGSARARIWYWRQVLMSAPANFRNRLQLARRHHFAAEKGDSMGQIFWQDLRYAARNIRRNPGFALVVIIILALGIAANTTVYSVVDNMVLNPFFYPERDSLVGIGPMFPSLSSELNFWEVLSPAEYQDIKSQSHTLRQVVCWDMGNRRVSGGDVPENTFSAFWWGNAFDTLRVRPALGRGFTYEETVQGTPVAIISHRFWNRRFGGDPAVIGRALQVNGRSYTLIGVMPPGTLILGTDLWLPMSFAPELMPRGRRQFQVLARLAPGVTLKEANTELAAIARRVEQEHGREFKEYAGWQLVAETWTRINTRLIRPAATILAGAVGFVMLLVCANTAAFFLSRTVRRRQEIAVRAALGARRGRIVSQLLVESVLLSMIGGLAGLALALFGLDTIRSVIEASPIPLPGEISVNSRILGFTAGLSILSGVLFGLFPALQITRQDIQAVLKSEGKSASPDAARLRLQSTLVTVEAALAMILLIGGGLLLNSFLRLQAVEPGFDPQNILTMRLTLPQERYQGAKITAFFETLLQRIETIPGVSTAGAASQFPPGGFASQQFRISDQEPGREGQLPTAFATVASEKYFETMRIPLLKGRTFTDLDRPGAPMVSVINDSLARRYFGKADPIGRILILGDSNTAGIKTLVIGVVGSTRNRGLDVPPQPEMFISIRQGEGWWNQLFLLIRTNVEAPSVLSRVRKEVAAIDPDQPVYAIQTVEEAFALSMAQRRIASVMISLFAILALVLAAIGIFSVVSYRVAARTREIGIRIALGAELAQVRRMIVTHALRPVLLGAGLGLVAGLGLSRLLTDLLYQVSATDPITIVAVSMLLIVVSLVASYLPARRASSLDPLTTLRQN